MRGKGAASALDGLIQSLTLSVQPILDRHQNIDTFEVLLRSETVEQSVIELDLAASAAVLHHAFSDLGVQTALGSHRAAINVSPMLLMSDAIEALSPDKVALEVAISASASPALLERCEKLRKKGYLLFADHVTEVVSSSEAFLAVADAAKVEIAILGHDALIEVTRQLDRHKLKKIALGVQTQRQADQLLLLGYDYLQGPYYAQPVVHPGKRLSSSAVALLQIMALAASDADTQELVNTFKHHPDLTVQLLQVVNSAGARTAAPIGSLDRAITVLGRKQLTRWVQILIFASGGSSGANYPSPLLILAATRARLMELVADKILRRDRRFQDEAFMAGMLSLMSALFGVDAKDIFEHLPVAKEIKEAVQERVGVLGNMLMLIEMQEQPGFEEAQFQLNGMEGASPETLMPLQVEAIGWANALGG